MADKSDSDLNSFKSKMKHRRPLSEIQDSGVSENNVKPAAKTSPNDREIEEPAPKRLKPKDSIIKECEPLLRESPLRSLNSNKVAKDKDLEFLVDAKTESNLNGTFLIDERLSSEESGSEIESEDAGSSIEIITSPETDKSSEEKCEDKDSVTQKATSRFDLRKNFNKYFGITKISQKIEQEQDIADLKLQLNATEQPPADLESLVRQKAEVMIKAQTEALKKEQNCLQEIKNLKEKIEDLEKSGRKDTKETIKSLKAKEAMLFSELNFKNNDEMNFKKVIDEFEKTFNSYVSEHKRLKGEHQVAKQHLATVYQKYKRAKTIIKGYKTYLDTLRQHMITMEPSFSEINESIKYIINTIQGDDESSEK